MTAFECYEDAQKAECSKQNGKDDGHRGFSLSQLNPRGKCEKTQQSEGTSEQNRTFPRRFALRSPERDELHYPAITT
jgi:hypothetical protein